MLGSLRARNRAMVGRDERSHSRWLKKTGEREKRGRRASCSSLCYLSQHRGFHQVGSGDSGQWPSIIPAPHCKQQDAAAGLWPLSCQRRTADSKMPWQASGAAQPGSRGFVGCKRQPVALSALVQTWRRGNVLISCSGVCTPSSLGLLGRLLLSDVHRVMCFGTCACRP